MTLIIDKNYGDLSKRTKAVKTIRRKFDPVERVRTGFHLFTDAEMKTLLSLPQSERPAYVLATRREISTETEDVYHG